MLIAEPGSKNVVTILTESFTDGRTGVRVPGCTGIHEAEVIQSSPTRSKLCKSVNRFLFMSNSRFLV